MNVTNSKECIVCGSGEITEFMEMKDMPVYSNVVWESRQEAVNAPRGDITLGFCRNCGHVFNTAYDLTPIDYNCQYENSLHFSPRFQKYATSLAKRLIKSYDLRNKTIVEIGCGRGDFLRMLCEMGDNRGIGFDPSFDETDAANNGHISIIKDYFSPAYNHYKPDMVCCRHVLEHIAKPIEFLSNLHESIGSRLQTRLIFEVPNGLFMFRDMSIWDIIYEHCSYYCKHSLKILFAENDFEIYECDDVFGGQFLYLEAGTARDTKKRYSGNKNARLEEYIFSFKKRYEEIIERWSEKLEQMDRQGKPAAVWGAGSKGITFLNFFGQHNCIEAAVDINPYKQGKFISCSGHKIISPKELTETGVERVIVMNPLYSDEIKKTICGLGFNAEAVCV